LVIVLLKRGKHRPHRNGPSTGEIRHVKGSKTGVLLIMTSVAAEQVSSLVGIKKEAWRMPSSACRVLLRVQLTTHPTLMQQANVHWEQVSQALQAGERHLECLQHRLSALQQILALEPTPSS
jgi:hypothetical protein